MTRQGHWCCTSWERLNVMTDIPRGGQSALSPIRKRQLPTWTGRPERQRTADPARVSPPWLTTQGLPGSLLQISRDAPPRPNACAFNLGGVVLLGTGALLAQGLAISYSKCVPWGCAGCTGHERYCSPRVWCRASSSRRSVRSPSCPSLHVLPVLWIQPIRCLLGCSPF